MSAPANGDRVTNRQLYDELKLLRGILDHETDRLRDELATKMEMRLTVALAVLGGNTIAALVLKFTSTGPAMHTAVGHLLGWL